MLAACAELGVAFVAYSPLGRSFLAGPVDVQSLAANDFRRSNPKFVGQAAEQNTQLVQQLAALADGLGATTSQVAIAWLLARQPHVIPIPGTRRTGYLESNVQATQLVLPSDVMARLDALFDPSRVAGARYPDAGFVGMESR
jgi:aryl-alcohol dehydrogenase-like predicted oxidoreductase